MAIPFLGWPCVCFPRARVVWWLLPTQALSAVAIRIIFMKAHLHKVIMKEKSGQVLPSLTPGWWSLGSQYVGQVGSKMTSMDMGLCYWLAQHFDNTWIDCDIVVRLNGPVVIKAQNSARKPICCCQKLSVPSHFLSQQLLPFSMLSRYPGIVQTPCKSCPWVLVYF
jgi:hypothetical protein